MGTVKPEFMIELEDQKVKVGDYLDYTLDNIEVSYGYLIDVTMRAGTAARFASFDKILNRFKVNGDEVSRDDIGFYPIEVTATFFNATFSESYKENFVL